MVAYSALLQLSSVVPHVLHGHMSVLREMMPTQPRSVFVNIMVMSSISRSLIAGILIRIRQRELSIDLQGNEVNDPLRIDWPSSRI